MSTPGSITHWIALLRQGDKEAAAQLWARYFQRLAAVARAQLGPGPRAAGDESDIALSAFHSFCQGAGGGQFADLQGRDELWRMLVVIAKRKAIDWLRHELADMRGGGRTQGDAFLDEVAGSEPTPEFAAELLDELRHLMDVLRQENDSQLSLIALRKSEGFTNREIAAQLSCSLRTVERKLLRIEVLWTADLERRRTPEGS